MTAPMPPEAEDAIMQAIEDNMPGGIRLDLGPAFRLAKAMYEAAAPAIAAAERERLQPELNRIERNSLTRIEELAAAQHAAVTEAVEAERERGANILEAVARVQHLAEAAQAKAVEHAVAAERERIIQQLTTKAAELAVRPGDMHATAATVLRNFARTLTDLPAT